MSGYVKKSDEQLTWLENRDKIHFQGRMALRRVLNVALAELDREYNDALKRGQLLKLTLDDSELAALLLAASQEVFAPKKELLP